MILDNASKDALKMGEIRNIFDKNKQLVIKSQFNKIKAQNITSEKQKIITLLNQCEDDDIFNQFEELAFYQERYTQLQKYLAKKGTGKVDQKKLIQNFQKNHYILEDSHDNMEKQVQFKKVQSMISEESKNKDNNNSQLINFDKNKNENEKGSQLGKKIYNFFQQKQKQIKPIKFSDLIQKNINSSISKSKSRSNFNFKKKDSKPIQELEIKKLLEENKRLHRQLQKKSHEDSELNEFQKNVLKEEKDRCLKRIEDLEEEVENLAITNFKFKELEKKKNTSTFINESLRAKDEMHVPYTLNIQHNDLNIISRKNKSPKYQLGENQNILGLVEEIPPIQSNSFHSFETQHQKMNKISNKYENQSLQNLLLHKLNQQVKQSSHDDEIIKESFMKKQRKNNHERNQKVHFMDSMDRGSYFDSFSMARTAYNNSSLFLNASKNLTAIDSETSTRNKVGFFKKSLVLIRNNKYEIAFKKSDMSSTMDKIRIIFYINNKTNETEKVNFEYDYDLTHFILETTQKTYVVDSQSQSRQVLEISLTSSSKDLNSVIDLHVMIGDQIFDLWVPICFVQWVYENVTDQAPKSNMIIQPDRQFSNFENMRKILPISQPIFVGNDEVQSYLFGRSKFGCHEVKLNWWTKQLTIECSEKILDLLAFIMHHYK